MTGIWKCDCRREPLNVGLSAFQEMGKKIATTRLEQLGLDQTEWQEMKLYYIWQWILPRQGYPSGWKWKPSNHWGIWGTINVCEPAWSQRATWVWTSQLCLFMMPLQHKRPMANQWMRKEKCFKLKALSTTQMLLLQNTVTKIVEKVAYFDLNLFIKRNHLSRQDNGRAAILFYLYQAAQNLAEITKRLWLSWLHWLVSARRLFKRYKSITVSKTSGIWHNKWEYLQIRRRLSKREIPLCYITPLELGGNNIQETNKDLSFKFIQLTIRRTYARPYL